jgi:hypothetical protein
MVLGRTDAALAFPSSWELAARGLSTEKMFCTAKDKITGIFKTVCMVFPLNGRMVEWRLD